MYFRGRGLLYDDNGILRVTPAGERLAQIMDDMFGIATMRECTRDRDT